MSTIVVKFDTIEDAERVDLTRIGTVTGRCGDDLSFVVEPEIGGWVFTSTVLVLACDVLRAGLAAAGVFAKVLTRRQYEALGKARVSVDDPATASFNEATGEFRRPGEQ